MAKCCWACAFDYAIHGHDGSLSNPLPPDLVTIPCTFLILLITYIYSPHLTKPSPSSLSPPSPSSHHVVSQESIEFSCSQYVSLLLHRTTTPKTPSPSQTPCTPHATSPQPASKRRLKGVMGARHDSPSPPTTPYIPNNIHNEPKLTSLY
ncbi:3982_t:CDS:1 [Acaulospora colombiana]|uniref:3982_t:CDS:1 n=1 Tax=Acaulospora colombiana TaxID=27376 RepID=A0ACA9P226_9GLOM|nr:3982_t:CDS:1 [Acaulospora colombiana]